MANLFLIGATDACGGLLPIVRVIVSLIKILMIAIPILLILMGTIDLGKAVLSSDDKEIKGAVGKLVKRAIAAIAVFFVATVVSLVMSLFRNSDNDDIEGTEDWATCWDNVRR